MSASVTAGPISWPIPRTSFTVRFQDYDYEVSPEGLYICLIRALQQVSDIIVRMRGDRIMDDEYTWASDGVEIYMENFYKRNQKVMQWSTASLVLSAIGEFAHEYHFTSAEFSVFDARRGANSIGQGHFLRDDENSVANATTVHTS